MSPRFPDVLYDLLCARAQSIGVIDIVFDADDSFVDAEITFSAGPGIGFSIDLAAGVCQYCELIAESEERWLGDRIEQLAVESGEAGDLQDAALEVLNGMLAARRSLQG